MSLINDALKRAKQAQQEAAPPPAPNLQLRPIEPAQYTRRGMSLMPPAVFVLAALVLFVLLWQRTHPASPAESTEVHARVAIPAISTTTPVTAPLAVAPPSVVQPVPETPPTPPVTPATDPAGVVEKAASPPPAEPPTVAASESPVTTTPAATEAPPPKPPLPKLQAIIFHPTRPSVIVGGRTLFVGDKLNGQRVMAIDKESVTMAGAGQTNVLTLAE
jgi:hypothetical protein